MKPEDFLSFMPASLVTLPTGRKTLANQTPFRKFQGFFGMKSLIVATLNFPTINYYFVNLANVC